MFEKLKLQPPDAIIGIMGMFRADPAATKVDLSVGVFQDEAGRTPILECVKRAERRIIEAQDTKSYVAITGNPGFNEAMEKLLFGAGHPALAAGRMASVQTPGGSGALSVLGHLIARARPTATVWLSQPSWPNHLPLLRLAGLTLAHYPYYDFDRHVVDFDGMVDTFSKLGPDDVVLLHGCCHNPCGGDLSREQWDALADLFAARGIVPFVDLAYQGLAENLEQDAYGARVMAERTGELLLAASCSKNLGLYRERVGLASTVARTADEAAVTRTNLAQMGRGIYSMPPDHGAAIVSCILHDGELTALWLDELGGMRDRLNGLRRTFADKLAERGAPGDFAFIARERGMFSFLGLTREQVIRLREEFHVYMVESSRINFAGLNRSNMDYVADSIIAVLQ
ncbi:MAG: aspartate/tyrosine/aromatic aminotransferase [Rhodospirillaceae bacterium]|nr:aspartate/tyrosine/aromatic aminotransferase [Rhodospirillaceae bacterium]